MSHLCETGSHLPGMLSARLQVSQRWERHAVNENLAGLGGRRAVPGVQEVAAMVCGLLTAENLPESFKTQMSSRNRHKTVPQGASDAGVWGFFCLRLIFSSFHLSICCLSPEKGWGWGRFGVLIVSSCPLCFSV